MFEIEEITPITGHRVDANDGVYYRYSAENWTVVMGESEEPVYDCSELEKEFQKFQKTTIMNKVLKNNISGTGYIGHVLHLLQEVNENKRQINELQVKVRDLVVCEKKIYKSIDDIFEELKKNNPEKYDLMLVKGCNKYRMMFASEGILYTIERDLGYSIESSPYSRIHISTQQLLQ